jgi:NitT/TauT family transport system permease protein
VKNKFADRINQFIPSFFGIMIFLTLWELISRLFSISPLILPPPSDVLTVLWQQPAYLLFNASITLLESIAGFLIGSIVAIGLGTLFIFFPIAEKVIYPYTIAFKSVPLVALAPIIVTWCGSGFLSKVLMAAIISFFPVLVSMVEGLKSVEPEALELMSMLSASKWEEYTKLRLPHSLKSLFAGLKVSSTFAIVGAIVAEFVGSENGIGYVVKSSSYYLDTSLTFAAIIIAGFLGVISFYMVLNVESKVIFWKTQKS